MTMTIMDFKRAVIARDVEISNLRAELAALREPVGDLVEVAASIMAGAHPGMPWDKIARAVLDAVLPRVRAEVLESLRPVSHWSVDWPPEEGEDSPPPDAAS